MGSKSSARENYYANQDGSHTVQLFQSPVNYQDGSGDWQPISTGLVTGSGGRLQEQANSVGVSLAPSSAGAPAAVPAASPSPSPSPSSSPSASADTGSGQLVDLSLGSGESAGWSLAGASDVTAQVSGATASYPGILPETTLELTGTATGVKESIVLSGPGGPTSWVFPMHLQGLSLSTDAEGDVDLVDSAGNAVATLPQPYAYDSSSGTATGLPDETFAMQYQITTYDGGPAVELALPASYAGSDLTYPVTVDPTVTESIAGDGDTTYITYGDDADYSSSDYLLIGSDNSGTNYSDSLLKFPSVPTDNGDHITAATLNLWDVYAGYCTGTTAFTVMPVTSSWTASGKKSWSNMPGTAAEIGKWGPADAPSAACSNTSKNLADGGALSVSLSTTYLQEIALGQYTDDGFAIAAGSDTLDDSYKEFASDNYSAHSPSLSVTYTPDQAPDIEHTWPTAGYQTSTLTPELEVQAVDPDAWPNASLSYNFSVYTSSGTLIASSGYIAATDWQVPAGRPGLERHLPVGRLRLRRVRHHHQRSGVAGDGHRAAAGRVLAGAERRRWLQPRHRQLHHVGDRCPGEGGRAAAGGGPVVQLAGRPGVGLVRAGLVIGRRHARGRGPGRLQRRCDHRRRRPAVQVRLREDLGRGWSSTFRRWARTPP